MLNFMNRDALKVYGREVLEFQDNLTEHARRLHKSWIERVSQKWQEWIVPLLQLLALVRFSVLVALVSIYILVINDQGQEVLRALAENGDPLQIAFFVIAAALCALVAWYWSRVAYFYSFNGATDSDPTKHTKIRDMLPRLIGATVFIAIGVAFARTSLAYAELLSSWNAWLSGPSAWSIGLAALFFALGIVFLMYARHLRAWFELRDKDRPADPDYIKHLPRKVWPFLTLGLAITVGLTLIFAYSSTEVAPLLGTGTIFLLFAAALIANGTFLVLYIGTRLKLPVIGFMLVWAVALSLFVDNHRVRQTAEMRSYHDFQTKAGSPRVFSTINSIEDYYKEWIADLEEIHKDDPAVPVIIVSAEGGGIRAAYWTALVLGEIQDRTMENHGINFARHVFAVSGVSGGSLGAATVGALLASDARGGAAKISGSCGEINDENSVSIRHRAHRILSKDFLSPTVASLLFPDFFQRFFPLAWLDDRAMALERSWEDAWRECEDGNVFAGPFADLWKSPNPSDQRVQAAFNVPLLFLNSTVVDSGQRMIATPIPFERASFDGTFSDALETTRVLGHDIPLSTAVHTSARFTYVSPAGTVRRLDIEPDNDNGQRWIRVVDGGYFENSGAVTAAEILTRIEQAATRRWHTGGKKAKPILPIVIHISNDPIQPVEVQWTRHSSKGAFFAEVMSPVEALLNVRPARGYQARAGLANYVRESTAWQDAERTQLAAVKRPGMHLHFRLCEYDVPLPLGWMLSQKSRSEMQAQLGDVLGKRLSPEPREIAVYHDHVIERLTSALTDSLDLPPESHLRVEQYSDCSAPVLVNGDAVIADAG